MGFQLKAQKYDWRHFILIPFQRDPIGTAVIGIQKLLTGLSAVFQVPVMAKFIDSAISASQGKASIYQVVLWFTLLLILVGWRRISYVWELGKKYCPSAPQIRVL